MFYGLLLISLLNSFIDYILEPNETLTYIYYVVFYELLKDREDELWSDNYIESLLKRI